MKKSELLNVDDYEEMRKLGVSEEDIQTLKNAMVIKETVDMLPANVEKFVSSVRQIFAGKDTGKEIMNFFSLAEKNPKAFMQVYAFFETMEIATNVEPSNVSKVTLDDIKKHKNQELENGVNDFVNSYNKLSKEDKEILVDIIKKLK